VLVLFGGSELQEFGNGLLVEVIVEYFEVVNVVLGVVELVMLVFLCDKVKECDDDGTAGVVLRLVMVLPTNRYRIWTMIEIKLSRSIMACNISLYAGSIF
jgi:hypothetical protein